MKDISSALDYPDNITNMFSTLSNWLEDETFLIKCLIPTLTSISCNTARFTQQDSILRLLLREMLGDRQTLISSICNIWTIITSVSDKSAFELEADLLVSERERAGHTRRYGILDSFSNQNSLDLTSKIIPGPGSHDGGSHWCRGGGGEFMADSSRNTIVV